MTTGRSAPSHATGYLDRIHTHGPDMRRVAGSLVTDKVRAYDLPRMFGRDRYPSPLGHAFQEYGRTTRTLHLLALVDPIDTGYRRTLHPAPCTGSSPSMNPNRLAARSSTANAANSGLW